jgi:hypothetical protein
MPNSLIKQLTAENAGKYKMSIRLASDGFSFVCRSIEKEDVFAYGKFDFESSKPYASSLKDTFFDNEWLSYPFKSVSVLQVTNQFLLVPNEYYDEDKKKELMKYAFSAPVSHLLVDEIKGSDAKLLFGMENDIYEFCSRSLFNPKFHHHLSPMITYWNTGGSASLDTRLYVCVRDANMDLLLYNEGGITFANSFAVEQSSDAVYYILYVWKQLGLDQRNDCLRFVGEEKLLSPISEEVKKYVKKVSVQDVPTEALLLGGEVLKSSFDLICLSLCEL